MNDDWSTIKPKTGRRPNPFFRKSQIQNTVNQNVGGIATGTAFVGVLAESSSLLISASILVMAGKAKDGITFMGEIEEHSLLG